MGSLISKIFFRKVSHRQLQKKDKSDKVLFTESREIDVSEIGRDRNQNKRNRGIFGQVSSETKEIRGKFTTLWNWNVDHCICHFLFRVPAQDTRKANHLFSSYSRLSNTVSLLNTFTRD